ncbi:hypothetical protein ACQ86G_30520 [Roseateles chitinivorans]|uniref:hypothetical protein n=1 Tax=Roseateles chitinivorans TaxID=2917965 RepID=UPI003D66DD90
MQSRQQQALNADRPLWRVLGVAVLGAVLWMPAAPAQASEVVKLARLLITGKRQPSRPPAPQPAAPERGTDASSQPQSRASDGELHAQTQRRTAEGAAVSMD